MPHLSANLGKYAVPHLGTNLERQILEPILGAQSGSQSGVPQLGANLVHPQSGVPHLEPIWGEPLME